MCPKVTDICFESLIFSVVNNIWIFFHVEMKCNLISVKTLNDLRIHFNSKTQTVVSMSIHPSWFVRCSYLKGLTSMCVLVCVAQHCKNDGSACASEYGKFSFVALVCCICWAFQKLENRNSLPKVIGMCGSGSLKRSPIRSYHHSKVISFIPKRRCVYEYWCVNRRTRRSKRINVHKYVALYIRIWIFAHMPRHKNTINHSRHKTHTLWLQSNFLIEWVTRSLCQRPRKKTDYPFDRNFEFKLKSGWFRHRHSHFSPNLIVLFGEHMGILTCSYHLHCD